MPPLQSGMVYVCVSVLTSCCGATVTILQEACKKDPEMLEVFAQIFGAGNVETGASADYNDQAKRQRIAASAREMSTKKKKVRAMPASR